MEGLAGKLEALVSDEARRKDIQGGRADALVIALADSFTGAKRQDVLTEAYRLLKAQSAPKPEFALKARLQAALARTSRQRAEDIATAEQLDLQLNTDLPDAWLHRGISYVRAKEEKYAVDMFLEGVRRMDFAAAADLFGSLAPPGLGWMGRVAKQGRMDDLHTAMAEAFTRTKALSAGPVAYSILEALLLAAATPDAQGQSQFQRVTPLLNAVREHQPHLLLLHFDELAGLIRVWDRSGRHDAAVTLARAVLLTPAGAGRSPVLEGGVEKLWLSESGAMTVEAPFPRLMKMALAEPSGEFLKESEGVARAHPGDMHLVSCVLLLHAMKRPLEERDLGLAGSLEPSLRLGVAQRLLTLGERTNVNPELFRPWFVSGYATLAGTADDAGGNLRLRLAVQLLSWLKPANSINVALPHVVSMAQALAAEQKKGVAANRDLWPQLAAFSCTSAGREACGRVLEEWGTALQAGPRATSGDWTQCRRGIHLMGQSMGEVEREAASDLARAGFRLWEWQWKSTHLSGDADALAAMHLLDCLMAADLTAELQTFESQVLAEISHGNTEGFEDTLVRLRSYRALFSSPGTTGPEVELTVGAPGDKGQGTRVIWRLTPPLEREWTRTIEDIQRSVESAETGRLPLRLGLPALAGKYELEIYAGENPETVRLVATLPAAAPKGSVVIKEMPEAGWVRAVLRTSSPASFTFGKVQPYASKGPMMDLTGQNQGDLPRWPEVMATLYGQPACQPLPIEAAWEYLLRVPPPASRRTMLLPPRVFLVLLNAKLQPIGMFSDLEDAEVATRVGDGELLFRPGDLVCMPGWTTSRSQAREGDQWEAPTHMVLTSRDAGPHPAVSVHRFLPLGQPRPEPLPTASPKFLAMLGFELCSWQISTRLHRAVFAGPGAIKVYDTSVAPWKPLLTLESSLLHGQESLHLLGEHGLVCVEWPNEARARAGFRLIPPGFTGAYESLPRTELPFNPQTSELAPDESGMVFTSLGEGALRSRFDILWMTPDGRLLTASAARPSVEPPVAPEVLWWGKDGTFAISEGSRIHQVKVSKEALTLERQETGPGFFAGVPEGARPGLSSRRLRYLLKRPDLLLRLDEATGDVVADVALPFVCRGAPIWLDDQPDAPVILRMDSGELVEVTLLKAVKKQP